MFVAHQAVTHHVHALVVGSGAAGLRAAERLHELGCRDVAVITEGMNCGTSRNTGSDKQTYYKLSLSGSDADSVREMAASLYAGQAVDGDIALCEAAASAGGFFHLAQLGVPFPPMNTASTSATRPTTTPTAAPPAPAPTPPS